jgi:hypothetical protein
MAVYAFNNLSAQSSAWAQKGFSRLASAGKLSNIKKKLLVREIL